MYNLAYQSEKGNMKFKGNPILVINKRKKRHKAKIVYDEKACFLRNLVLHRPKNSCH